MAKRKALGETLSSIFDDAEDFEAGQAYQFVKIGDIEPNRNQPRKHFDQDKLTELADSIAGQGVIFPLIVRENDGGGYMIVDGERRWRAARIAGLSELPVIVKDLTEEQVMQISLIANLQREDLNPIEEAAGFKDLIDNYKMTQDEVAKAVGKARSSVTNALRLLTLPDEVVELLRGNKLSKGHCKAIMGIRDSARMTELAKRAASGELSVRETEQLAKQEPAPKKARPPVRKKPFFAETEIALSEVLKTNVKIVAGSKKNTLCIDFSDEDELKLIVRSFNPQ